MVKNSSKPETPVETSDRTEFERGAVFALELLKKHVTTRTDHLRNLNAEFDVGGVLNGLGNVLLGLQGRFETDLMKQLFVNHAARKTEGKPE